MIKKKWFVSLLVIGLLISQNTASRSGEYFINNGVPYYNQITDFPNWWNNWSSCGFTCMLMALDFNNARPTNMTPQQMIELLNANCCVNPTDGQYYDWTKTKDFCQNYLSEYELKVEYIDHGDTAEVSRQLHNGNVVILGTMIFGGCGHVILAKGEHGNNWIVSDPLNKWGKEVEPPSWWTEDASTVEYPKDQITILYGVVISREIKKDYAAKISDQSPTAILYDQNSAMLWVRIKNCGRETWESDKVHLGTINPNDCPCILRVGINHEYAERWLTENRVKMEQNKVEPDGEALFGIPVTTNGFDGIISLSFQMVYDDEEKGERFGPNISWQVECRQSKRCEAIKTPCPVWENDKYYFHKGSVHNHTTWSDGSMNITALCQQAKKAGMDFIAITDHSDYFNSSEQFKKYVEEINQSRQQTGICTVAGIEYTMQNYDDRVTTDPHDSTVHIIGLGYNQNQEVIVPPFFPWTTYGPTTTVADLIDWHYQHRLPIIVCHPIIRGKDGYSNADLIKAYKYADYNKIAAMEFFDIGYDTNTIATVLKKLVWPGLEDNEAIKLYRDCLAPSGVGVSACSDFHGVPPDFSQKQILGNNVTLTMNNDGSGTLDPGWGKNATIKIEQSMVKIIQSMDRAKTTVITKSPTINVGDVVAGYNNHRTIASRYHETFDEFTINKTNWAPGKWPTTINSGQNIRFDMAIQFHEGKELLENKKEVVIMRNCKKICDQIATLGSDNKLQYSFADTNLMPGVYQYIIFVGGLELNDRAQERIITSPIYVKVADKQEEQTAANQTSTTGNANQKIITIFSGLIHLGDSNYSTPLNVGFSKKDDEGKVGTWKFTLQPSDFEKLQSANLVMTIRGAEKLDRNYIGNPIELGLYKIGECLVKDGKLENNGKYHSFPIDVRRLYAGTNCLMIRSIAHWIGNHYDYDDFEISDLKLVLNYGTNSILLDNHMLPILAADEATVFGVEKKDGFGEKEKQAAQEAFADFSKRGGKLVKDEKYLAKVKEMLWPIASNINLFDRYDKKNTGYMVFESKTYDPIVLTNGTIMIPTGLINLYNNELPESFIFPILSEMVQADKGITWEQSNRTDWIKVLGTIGTIASAYNGQGGQIVKSIGTGLMLASAIGLKTQRDDYFISDALALEMLIKMNMDVDDAFSFLDALSTMETKNPDKLAVFYLYAPTAKERLKALKYYYLLRYENNYPLTPYEINWDKVLDDGGK